MTSIGNGLLVERKHPIESDFPFELISEIAEIESWRKEIYRPIYHFHKWWAQRLGSVFRAIILSAAGKDGSNLSKDFYENVRFPGVRVFDPFMGSGTTIGEAHKLGCIGLGKDINPVAFNSVRSALGRIDELSVEKAYRQLERTVGKEIQRLYKWTDNFGHEHDVLYYFWVKTLPCPSCISEVDLFSSFIFARHAYSNRFPKVQIVCPECSSIFSDTIESREATCASCSHRFNPHEGNTKREKAYCRKCNAEFSIAKTAKSFARPPNHRLYAKLVLSSDGRKRYVRIDDSDTRSYKEAAAHLQSLSLVLPDSEIKPGYNTNQVLNYGYSNWSEFFNARQLLALGKLGNAISTIEDDNVRLILGTIFSGCLEFNNMFSSYKGEGTGAVRHMFSHHILKPERTPIEANVWGTPKSSGAFSTVFKSRFYRLVEYKKRPFEAAVKKENGRKIGSKKFVMTKPLDPLVETKLPTTEAGFKENTLYLECGSSTHTTLPDHSIDFIVTDPPFFDNVHYSELADFFHVWQNVIFPSLERKTTTRHIDEVQDSNSAKFSDKLSRVFRECYRILKPQGLLIFTYHHSRNDGWESLLQAVTVSGFSIVKTYPIKSEMSGATPKNQAKNPIDIDIIMVCRRFSEDHRPKAAPSDSVPAAVAEAERNAQRFHSVDKQLSSNDLKAMTIGSLISHLSAGRSNKDLVNVFNETAGLAINQTERLSARVEQAGTGITADEIELAPTA